MSAVTMHRSVPAAPATTRLVQLVSTIRWAPAPRFEGDAAHRATYVAYLVGSMLAWTLAGVVVAVGIDRLLALAG
ncbi:hypothetical protein [Cellulomonas fimi]|uniref:CheW protein n=1 Tax=Cellulomonas fimi (strain ATCC 484 / DSM 20113 / JCM 1341 / CCUG 24087 / LMG 16345 / NBRC 15513 / NCIMB 8980 / NCTC 7547 / NRS-133) TaxID=590998 RepID=F4H6Z2_CELFA|nr:hypothetical protein [Cellulomonas fimi]AEE44501.1 CheW protein [Cellulomonas fimi ATCC 484]NNH06600.1 chemotaxis protein CheW [Cellulomonas fimi]VEH26487.1 Uncharacterised protein [Cellulomonas fimi]